MRKLLFVISLAALAATMCACASASAKTKPAERPPLAVPPPPPRVIESAPQPAQPAPVAPPSTLRTPGTADSAEAARQVREVLDRTTRVLANINYQNLSRERKKAYDDAKELMIQADSAMKDANYVFAQSIAQKAEKLAKELQGR